jgi:two-component system CheB/CheR fusion protein
MVDQAAHPKSDGKRRAATLAWRYGLALALVILATGVRWLLFRYDQGRIPFLVYFPVVIAVALFAGVGPAIVAICLSTISATRWLPDFHSSLTQPVDVFILIIFLAVCGVQVVLCEAFRRTRSWSQSTAAALAESEKRFRMLCESAPVGIALSRRGTLLYVNPPYRRMFGYGSDTNLEGTSVIEQVAPSHREIVRENIRRRFEGEDVVTQYELVGVRVDGQEFPYIVNVGRVELENGTATIAFISDITARKRTEAALAHSESQHRAFFDIVSVGLAEAEWGSFRLLRVNDRFCSLTGYSRDQLLGLNVLELTHPEDRDREIVEREELLAEQRSYYEVEKRYIRQDGSIVWVNVSVTAVKDADGRPVCVAAVIQDISDRKRVEQDREALLKSEQAARAAAEHASQAKDQFLAALSHELRTPLTPVLLTTSLLEAQQDLPPQVRQDLAVIRRNVELEARLIDDLLDLTRVARGKLQLHREVTDAHVLLQNAAEVCRHAPGGRIELQLPAERFTVNVDSARFQQVFWNLLNNAKKFTSEDGRIVVRSSNPDDQTLRIEVTDNGSGVDPHLLPNIFDAFVQGGMEGRPKSGLGLGLAICQAIVNAHRGSISASSEGKGKGATFCVEIPTVVAAEHSGDRPAAGLVDFTNAEARSLSILLVEDNLSTLGIMHRLLVGMGHRVSPASTVQGALELAEREKHDLLVSDLGLPDGTGYELMQTLRERYRVTGVALSGYGMEEDIRRSLEAGFAEHLTKPIDLPRLKQCLARCATANRG